KKEGLPYDSFSFDSGNESAILRKSALLIAIADLRQGKRFRREIEHHGKTFRRHLGKAQSHGLAPAGMHRGRRRRADDRATIAVGDDEARRCGHMMIGKIRRDREIEMLAEFEIFR